MSGKQKEEASRNLRGNLINKISPVIDGLPSKFTASELYGAAGIVAKGPYRRMLVASVLRSAFKCEQVNGFWRKL